MGRALVELLTANFRPEISNWAAAVLGEPGKGSRFKRNPSASGTREATGARLSWSTITRTCAHWATASDCWPKGVAKRYPLQAAAVLAEVQAPGYRRREPEPAKGWLNRLLG